MSLYQLDDVFTYQDANEIKMLWASVQEPDTDNVEVGEIWLNTLVNPPQLNRWNGAAWVVIGSTNFIKNNADDSFSGTLTSTKTSGAAIRFDNGDAMIGVHDGGNFTIKSGVDENNIIIKNNGGSRIAMADSGGIVSSISKKLIGETYTEDIVITLHQGGIFLSPASGVAVNMTSTGTVISGSTEFKTEVVIPLAAPAAPKNGSMWLV